MNQNIWGPHLWFSLHTISFNYPLKPTNEDKTNYKNFFNNLQNIIPCSVCKKNYKRHITEHPIEDFLGNRQTLVYWVIDIHNMDNAEIGKKILSYVVVIKKYEDVYNKKLILNDKETKNKETKNKKTKNNNVDYNNFIYGIFIIFIILLLINLMSSSIKNYPK